MNLDDYLDLKLPFERGEGSALADTPLTPFSMPFVAADPDASARCSCSYPSGIYTDDQLVRCGWCGGIIRVIESTKDGE